MAIAETVKKYLDAKSIDYDVVSHAHSGSSHETADAAHIMQDHIAKAVVVRDASGYAVVVVPASHWVDMKHVRRELDRELELVAEDELGGLFNDCETGAVPPLGPAYGIETFLDEAVASLANVYFEAGDHRHLIHTSGDGHFSHDQ